MRRESDNLYEYEEESSEGEVNEYLLKAATEMAGFLTGKGNIRRVGLFGSLAKGKDNVGDIDLALFIDDDKALELLKDQDVEAMTRTPSPKRTAWESTRRDAGLPYDYGSYVRLQYLGFGEEDNGRMVYHSWLSSAVESTPFQYTIISESPSREFLEATVKRSRDPNFVVNLVNNALIYNRDTRVFEKRQVYPEDTFALIKEITHERIKELAGGLNEEHLDYIENHPRLKPRGQ